MIRIGFVLGMVVFLIGGAVAQEPNPPVGPKPAPPVEVRVLPAPRAANANPAENADLEYVIEMRLLEGKHLFTDDAAWRDLTTGNSNRSSENTTTATRRVRIWTAETPAGLSRSSEKTTTATAAHPVAPPAAASGPVPSPPAIVVDPSETAKNPGEDELWDGHALDALGITTVAMPKIMALAKHLIPLQIQTSQPFVYLEPLGNDQYQAKRIPKQELGMKITVAVQPADGDDTFVDVSPLEIQITALDGREPVEGLDLEVGKPIISTRSLKTTAKMKLGATRLIAIPSGPKAQAVLLLRVKRPPVRFKTFILERGPDGLLEPKKEK